MGDDINYGAHAASDSIDYGAHQSADQPSALSRFASAFDPRPLIKRIFTPPPNSENQDGFTMLARNVLGIGKDLAQAQGGEYAEATKAAKEGRVKDAIAHGVSALIPILGPASQRAADKINSGDIAGGLGDLAAMAVPVAGEEAPALAAKAAPVVSTAARVTGAAAKAGAGDVAMGSAKIASGLVAAKAASALGVPEIASDFGIGLPAARAGGKQIIEGVKAGYQAGKKAGANPAVSRVEDAFDAAKAKVITSPGQAPIAGPVPQGVGEPDNFSWPSEAGKGPIEAQPQPIMPNSGLTPANGMPAQPPPSGPLNYADTQNPDVAKTLQPGAQRVLPNGKTETLRTVPLQEIEVDPGNTIYEDTVDKYQKNGYAVQPQLRWNDLNDPEAPGKFVINDGHHRILADARNGKSEITAWTPDEEAPSAGLDQGLLKGRESTPGAGLSQAMGDLPAPMRQAAADANYRAIKEGAPAADAAATYKAAARATKVETLGQHLIESGFTPEELEAFPPDKLKARLAERIKTLGINKTGDISGDTISQVLAWMRKQKP